MSSWYLSYYSLLDSPVLTKLLSSLVDRWATVTAILKMWRNVLVLSFLAKQRYWRIGSIISIVWMTEHWTGHAHWCGQSGQLSRNLGMFFPDDCRAVGLPIKPSLRRLRRRSQEERLDAKSLLKSPANVLWDPNLTAFASLCIAVSFVAHSNRYLRVQHRDPSPNSCLLEADMTASWLAFPQNHITAGRYC